MNSKFFGNILFHVALMATFLTIFFFTVASKIEGQIVKEQVNFVMDDIIGDTFQYIPSEQERAILINNLASSLPDASDLKSADEAVKKNNEKTFKTAVHFLIVIVGITIALLIAMAVLFNWDFQDIKFLLISGITGLIFVAITEMTFLLVIAKNYISADPNLIRSQAIKTIVCNSNSKLKNC
tara:strand:- start:271 stop:816 length:546 start_codon:yes stop_codon:yes gene_type:complete